jgi:hypothetical protein
MRQKRQNGKRSMIFVVLCAHRNMPLRTQNMIRDARLVER